MKQIVAACVAVLFLMPICDAVFSNCHDTHDCENVRECARTLGRNT